MVLVVCVYLCVHSRKCLWNVLETQSHHSLEEILISEAERPRMTFRLAAWFRVF